MKAVKSLGLVVLLIFLSCKKENFLEGVYEVYYTYEIETENGTEVIENNSSLLRIDSQTKDSIIVYPGHSTQIEAKKSLKKTRNLIEGEFPGGIFGFSVTAPKIKAHKVIFTKKIKGTFIKEIMNNKIIEGEFILKKL